MCRGLAPDSIQLASAELVALRLRLKELKPNRNRMCDVSWRWPWLGSDICVASAVSEFVPGVPGTAVDSLGHCRVFVIVEGNSDIYWTLCRLLV